MTGTVIEVEPLSTTDGGAPTYVNCYRCAGLSEEDLAWSRFTGRRGTLCTDCGSETV